MGYAWAFRYYFAEYFFRQGQVNHAEWDDQRCAQLCALRQELASLPESPAAFELKNGQGCRFWTDLYLGQHLEGDAADMPKLAIDNEGLVIQVRTAELVHSAG